MVGLVFELEVEEVEDDEERGAVVDEFMVVVVVVSEEVDRFLKYGLELEDSNLPPLPSVVL